MDLPHIDKLYKKPLVFHFSIKIEHACTQNKSSPGKDACHR